MTGLDVRAIATLARQTPAPPVRIIHLGLGAFSRSHIAWYTQHAVDGSGWGIAAYTGRSRELADALTRQDGLYTLIERDMDGDHREVISSIVRAHPGDDVASLITDFASPATVIATLTITEVGYRLDATGSPDLADPLVLADLAILNDIAHGAQILTAARPQTTLVRLLLGLEARRLNNSGPIALLSCDNVPDNGGRLQRAVLSLAESLSPDLVEWIRRYVTFPSSSVDRITPRLSEAESQALAHAAGDEVPVVAEPFSDWVISGEFPGGRPQWETAGARFVDNLEPWEARKLWMLNGAHTLLACLGLLRGHHTVAEAVDDPVCRQVVERLWDEDAECLPSGLALDAYRAALLHRFGNERIEHRLEQIATDSLVKLRLRIVPVAELLLTKGERPRACATAIAVWVDASRRGLLPEDDRTPNAASTSSIAELLTTFGGAVASSADFARDVDAALRRLHA